MSGLIEYNMEMNISVYKYLISRVNCCFVKVTQRFDKRTYRTIKQTLVFVAPMCTTEHNGLTLPQESIHGSCHYYFMQILTKWTDLQVKKITKMFVSTNLNVWKPKTCLGSRWAMSGAASSSAFSAAPHQCQPVNKTLAINTRCRLQMLMKRWQTLP